MKTARNKAELAAAESDVRTQEKSSVDILHTDSEASDPGSNPSGMYELCGMCLLQRHHLALRC